MHVYEIEHDNRIEGMGCFGGEVEWQYTLTPFVHRVINAGRRGKNIAPTVFIDSTKSVDLQPGRI